LTHRVSDDFGQPDQIITNQYDNMNQNSMDNSEYTNSSPPHEEIDIKKRDFSDDISV